MDIKLIANLSAFLVVGVVVVYSILKQKRKDDRYFGDIVKYSKKERQIMEGYKKVYQPIESDDRIASFKRHGYMLEDIALSATEMIYDHPLPSREAKAELKPGHYVQLKFIDKNYEVERMWVEIITVHKDWFHGELRNEAYGNRRLKYGADVWFHPNHIFQIR